MKRIVLSTSGVNRYGYRVLTSGIKLDAFRKNPVMFLGHSTYGLPIGIWEDIKVEGDELTAVPKFDEVTEVSRQTKACYEAGSLSAASIGFRRIATSDNPELTLAGQKYETVTECDLLEVSIVGVPANSAATIKLNFDIDTDLKLLSFIDKNTTDMDIKKIAAHLGLAENATEENVLSAIDALSAENRNAILELGVSKGIVNDDNRNIFESQILSNPTQVKAYFDKAEAKLGAVPEQGTPPAALSLVQKMAQARTDPNAVAVTNEKLSWTLDDWRKKDSDGLLAMKVSNPKQYEALMGEH